MSQLEFVFHPDSSTFRAKYISQNSMYSGSGYEHQYVADTLMHSVKDYGHLPLEVAGRYDYNEERQILYVICRCEECRQTHSQKLK